ncbi:MAG: class I SAM-dependent methyltransferase [Planctomycetes bacterium]|nr:class I SAM-dependent methyltransferase [Planctomycetota bacterium]
MLSLPSFLASLGKAELKPGGAYGTKALIRLLGLRGGMHTLVIGPASAPTALFVSMTSQATTEALVHHLSERVTEDDPSLRRRSTARVGKAEELPFADARFDAAMVEASLAELPLIGQARVLREVARVLKPGGLVGLHELCWRQPPTPDREAALGAVWGTGVYPHVMRGWWDALEEAGFGAIHNEVAVVSWFSRRGMEQDEGEKAAEIFHSAFEDQSRLQRFTAAYREFHDFRRYYGAALCVGRKP